MATVVANVQSGDPDVDALLSFARWNPFVLLRFGFPQNGGLFWSGYSGNSEPYQNYAPLNAAQQAVVTAIFQAVEQFANISFVNSTTVNETPESATFRFGMTDEEEVAHAYVPTSQPAGGDVWLNRSSGEFNNPVRGDYSYSAIMHEIGHALGLLHPHDGDNFGTMSLTHDNMNYTVMTYRSYFGMDLDEPFPNGNFGFPQTFMMYDIAALQHMYGANFNSRSGNTTYKWDPATGYLSIDGSVSVAPGANVIFMTIWDGGGIDTYDFSTYGDSVIVSLVPGEWSTPSRGQLANLGNGHLAIGNIANAFLYHGDPRSLIENAIGGAGEDVLIGNQAANTLSGGGAHDILDGGLGADTLIGGAGRDTYKVDDPGDVIVETPDGDDDTADVAAATYVLGANVEQMNGVSTSGGQTLTGNESDNLIVGNNLGGNGLSGAGGNDTIYGGTGADHILGGDGADKLHGLSGNDSIEGGDGNDFIDGWANDDLIDGGAGNDTIWGSEGADHIFGGAGADLIQGHNDEDTIEGGDGDDSIEGGGSGDTLYGNAGDDFIYADQKPYFDPVSQAFSQPSPQDYLGLDILIGGSGADSIMAGVGTDRIVYLDATDSTAAFQDRILKFESGSDKVDLSALVVSALSWTELNDPGDGVLYSLVAVTTPGLQMKIRIDGHVAMADFLVTLVSSATEGDDLINGTAGDDQLDALGGNDLLNLQQGGNDQVAGGSGDDDFSFGAAFTAADLVNGGTGLDRVLLAGDYSAGLTLVSSTLSGIERIVLGSGFDYRLISADANVAAGLMLRIDASQLAAANALIFDGSAETDGAFDLIGGAGNDQLTGGSGNDLVQGNAGNDTISTGDGLDFLDGGTGIDLMAGGAGDDIYIVDDSADQAVEAASGGFDLVRSTASFALGAEVENLVLTGTAAINGTGNALGNYLGGNSGDNVLDGGLAADTMEGGLGNDVYIVDNGGDTITELSGEGTDEVRTGLSSFTLGANVENLTGTSASGQALTGNGLVNVIIGGSGDDLLDGGLGADVLRGGLGNDIYVVDEPGDNIAELADWGTDEVQTGLAVYALADHFENLTGTAASGQVLVGNDLDNVISGSGGADHIDGGLGADAMAGGLGDDVFYLDNVGDAVSELVGEGYDEVRTALASHVLSANVEKLTGTSAAGQSLTGNGSANLIVAGSGNDVLDGGASADTMAGRLGNDIYIVDEGGDSVSELGGEGSDEIRTALASYSLAALANVENLTGLGNGDQSLTGNGADNIINGGSGADTMTGGLGNDTYIVDSGGDVMIELAGEGNDTIRTSLLLYDLRSRPEVENLTASNDSAREFRGNGLNNVITGAGGNDFLILWDGGNDTVVGGGGNDVILFGGTLTSADSVDGGTGTDQAVIQGDYSGGLTLGAAFVGIESFAILPGSDIRFGDPGTNFYDYNITTTDSNVAAGVLMVVDANRLRVGEDFSFNGSAESDGAFFLYGGRGTDTFLGGSKNDTFYFGENLQFGSTDHVDGGSAGTDQLGLRGSYTIVFGATQLTSIESIGLVSAQDTRFGALGTSYNYNLTMNDGNVAAGVRMTVDAAPLRPSETFAFDGSAEVDGSFRIFGGQGTDTITGSQGNDLITGSLGSDSLRGGGGNDTFIYRAAGESTSAARDTILDFSSGDVVNLAQIDAVAGGSDDAFTFIGSAAFSNTAGELRAAFDAGNGVWTVQGDVNGDGIADIEFVVTSDHPMVGGDFAL